MDYVFFGFSSLIFGLCLLLVFFLSSGRDGPLSWWQILLALGAGLAYYYLDYAVFHKTAALYYLGNTIPQILLIVLVVLFLLQHPISRRA